MVLLLVIHFFYWTSISASERTADPFADAAQRIHDSYDPSVEPCDDFYQYACGKWLEEHKIPDDASSVGSFESVGHVVALRLSGILSNDTPSNSAAETKAKEIYKGCMDTASMNSRPILDFMVNIDAAFNSKNKKATFRETLTNVMSEMTRGYGFNPLFSSRVTQNETNSSINIMTLYVRFTIDGIDLKRYLDVNGTKGAFENFLNTSFDEVFRENPTAMCRPNISKVMSFIEELTQRTSNSTTFENITSTNHTVKDSFSLLQQLVPEMDWDQYMKAALPFDVHDFFLTNGKPIEFGHEVFQILGSLLRNTELRVLRDYFVVSYFYQHYRFLPEKYESFAKNLTKLLTGKQSVSESWKRCALLTQELMPTAVGVMYGRQYFSDVTKSNVTEMTRSLKAAMTHIMKGLGWLDEVTEQAAVKKVEEMFLFLGYPEAFKNLTDLDRHYVGMNLTNKDSFFEMVTSALKWQTDDENRALMTQFDRSNIDFDGSTVNAFHYRNYNAIVFTAGILESPFYSDSFPSYMNYGAMGLVIGHEIAHGFDNRGRNYDEIGVERNWWSNASAAEFNEKANCFVQQYASFNLRNTDQKINGNLTLGENIADNGGLEAAYLAYKQKGLPEGRLPGLDLTNDQAFFLSYASVWCGKETKEALNYNLLSDPHSPREARVIVTLSNSKKFSEAFQCPSGSRMNPKKKCAIWTNGAPLVTANVILIFANVCMRYVAIGATTNL